MAIQQLTMDFSGEASVNPRWGRMICDDSLTVITTAGYLNPVKATGEVFYNSDYIVAQYSGGKGIFSVSVDAAGIVTLSQENSDVVLPTIANHFAVFTNTSGTIGDDAATAINGGNIQAGLSGTAGYLASFPATAAKGSLRLTAVANTGDTLVTISNAAHGQASVYSIPDVGAATGQFLVKTAALVNGNLVQASGTAGVTVDSGVATSNVQLKTQIKAATTANIGGAGAGPLTIAVAGVTAASVVVASIATSANAVSVQKVTPGSGGFDILLSGDPGATLTVSYIAYIAAQ